MKYRSLLNYPVVEKLKSEVKNVRSGLYLLDLDPLCDKVILGPYESIAEAHEGRDNLWSYGETFGRYLWLVSKYSSEILQSHAESINYVELAVDTLPMEITGMKIKVEGVNEWLRVPRKRITT